MDLARARTYHDCFNVFLGDWIGEGIHRKVFTCTVNPDLVVKVEIGEDHERRNFANVHEFDFWLDHKDREAVAKWLAPCEKLSPDGRILLQRRTDPLGNEDKLPDKLPAFLTDLKRGNFGKLDGRIVCCDYSATIPNPSLRMKKAEWY